ncbi:PAS domain-containing protein [uncultured Christiangramia sp.]|uniref:PAS domain-containing protein n=1 Tax=uncultured Christiangramia sp. TaxID=503836 RepID=UPI0025DF0A9B|nr:PAS domain-containing protein [uncultured Christiangramia sp.]|tara:strand:+ start:4866 stop:5432 length:567 start_codon:yes stop_codon:yes gene_type:complete
MKNNLYNMRCLDIYLSGLSKEQYDNIKHEIDPSKMKRGPLVSWDIFMDSYQKKIRDARKSSEIKQVYALAEKFRWRNDLKLAFKEYEYEALVITDLNQKIIWLNDGFTKMTGYSKNFAINKSPKFLHGENTSLAAKLRFREKIAQNKPFKEIIINYKKDRTAYNCEIKVIPLFNDNTTHYLAFEQKVR